jgi:hypothetical protein
MDRMQAPPRGAFFGLLSDLASGTVGYMQDPRRTQQMQSLGAMLESTRIPSLLEGLSYGDSMTTGSGMTMRPNEDVRGLIELATAFAPAGKPAAAAAKAGTMALGRAGERVGMAAEKALEAPLQRAYDKGGLSREMLLAMGQNTVSPATVFHGSPHRFNKFDSSKIGTGEGAQVYGHGLYLAENPAVAKEYSKLDPVGGPIPSPLRFISGQEVQPGTGAYKAASLLDTMTLPQARKMVDGWMKDARPDQVEYFQEVASTLASIPKKSAVKQAKPGGNLYQVDLPDEQIAKMLDFDKPLSQQTPEIKAKLKAVVDDQMGAGTWNQWLKTSPDFKNLEKDLFEDKAPQEISALLRQAGIPGVRYLDQGSRATPNITNKRLADLYEKYQGNAEAAVDEMMRSVYNSPKKKAEMREQFMKQLQTPKTSNFVVFPGMEDMLRIEQINEQPINSLLQTLGR